MNALAPLRRDLPAVPEPHRFTLDDVIALRRAGVLDPDARVELMDGEILDMPAEGELHAWFKAELIRFLVRALGDEYRVGPEIRLSLAPGDAPVPDIYVMPSDIRLTLTPAADLHLVIEVADSTLSHDLRRKAAKYAGYGAPEYWVIDVRGRRTHVHLRPEGDTYLDRKVVEFDAALKPSRLPNLELVIADLPRFDTLSFD